MVSNKSENIQFNHGFNLVISTLAFQDFQNLDFYETEEGLTSYNKNNWDDIVQNHVLYSNCFNYNYYVRPGCQQKIYYNGSKQNT